MILAAVLFATLTADGHRPISDLAAQLEKADRNLVVTYEEAAWRIEDTEEIHHETGRTRAPRRAAVSFSCAEGTRYPEMLESLLAQARDAGAAGSFRVEGSGSIYHIVPRGESVLDTRITLEDKERTVDDTLDEILPQLPYSLGWGFVPLNLFVQTKVRIAAKDEPARSVFRRILIEISKQKPYHVSWQLNHDPFMDRYILSFLIVHAPQ